MPGTDQSGDTLLTRLAKMSARGTRHKYDIGDYWNITEEAHDVLLQVKKEIDEMQPVVAKAEKIQHAAVRYIDLLEKTIKALLETTEHPEGDCDDPNCPVEIARKVLDLRKQHETRT